MGDKSHEALVNLGDVVLINTGDGVFTGREPHTSNQSNDLFIHTLTPNTPRDDRVILGRTEVKAASPLRSRLILLEQLIQEKSLIYSSIG